MKNCSELVQLLNWIDDNNYELKWSCQIQFPSPIIMLMFTATARRSHPELFICCFYYFVFLCFCLLLFFCWHPVVQCHIGCKQLEPEHWAPCDAPWKSPQALWHWDITLRGTHVSMGCEPNIDSCQVNEAPTPSGSKIPTHIKAWSWPKVSGNAAIWTL